MQASRAPNISNTSVASCSSVASKPSKHLGVDWSSEVGTQCSDACRKIRKMLCPKGLLTNITQLISTPYWSHHCIRKLSSCLCRVFFNIFTINSTLLFLQTRSIPVENFAPHVRSIWTFSWWHLNYSLAPQVFSSSPALHQQVPSASPGPIQLRSTTLWSSHRRDVLPTSLQPRFSGTDVSTSWRSPSPGQPCVTAAVGRTGLRGSAQGGALTHGGRFLLDLSQRQVTKLLQGFFSGFCFFLMSGNSTSTATLQPRHIQVCLFFKYKCISCKTPFQNVQRNRIKPRSSKVPMRSLSCHKAGGTVPLLLVIKEKRFGSAGPSSSSLKEALAHVSGVQDNGECRKCRYLSKVSYHGMFNYWIKGNLISCFLKCDLKDPPSMDFSWFLHQKNWM